MAPRMKVMDMLALELGHEPTKVDLERLNDTGIIELVDSVRGKLGDNASQIFAKELLLKETKRQVMARVGERLQFSSAGDNGWSVKIPDPQHQYCSECLSSDHWQFKDAESEGPFQTEFTFECANEYSNEAGEWICQGMLIMSNLPVEREDDRE